jgi:hypothetical protein
LQTSVSPARSRWAASSLDAATRLPDAGDVGGVGQRADVGERVGVACQHISVVAGCELPDRGAWGPRAADAASNASSAVYPSSEVRTSARPLRPQEAGSSASASVASVIQGVLLASLARRRQGRLLGPEETRPAPHRTRRNPARSGHPPSRWDRHHAREPTPLPARAALRNVRHGGAQAPRVEGHEVRGPRGSEQGRGGDKGCQAMDWLAALRIWWWSDRSTLTPEAMTA